MAAAAILDIDGTLVDTNYHHALAWYRALRQHEIVLPRYRIHRHARPDRRDAAGPLDLEALLDRRVAHAAVAGDDREVG